MSTQDTPQVALITGSSRGLGRSMARHLAARGVYILGTYHSNDKEAETATAEFQALGVKTHFFQLDVSSAKGFPAFAAGVSAQLDSWGISKLDMLVQNAGIGIYAPLSDTTEEQLDQLYHVHLKAPLLLTQVLLPKLGKGSRMLNISSGLSRFTFPGYGAYAAMKGAVEVLTRYQAKELGAKGIVVNTLAPGAIETDFGGGVVRDNEALNQQIAAGIALGRAGLPDDIGAAATALLLGAGSWINGQRIEASGGQML